MVAACDLVCAECGREPRDDENPLDEWPAYSDGAELFTFCPECAEREFGTGGASHALGLPGRADGSPEVAFAAPA